MITENTIKVLLKKIGLKEKYVCKSPKFKFWSEEDFEFYTTSEYHKSHRKEVDEFYRIHESNLLHKKTGIRVRMSSSEDYTGEEVTYKIYKVFFINNKKKEIDILKLDLKKKTILFKNGVLSLNDLLLMIEN